jgi:hypothetical protein
MALIRSAKPRKADLPVKVCLVCARPFAWRKKWARDWDEVKYCSDRCRAAAPRSVRKGDAPRE